MWGCLVWSYSGEGRIVVLLYCISQYSLCVSLVFGMCKHISYPATVGFTMGRFWKLPIKTSFIAVGLPVAISSQKSKIISPFPPLKSMLLTRAVKSPEDVSWVQLFVKLVCTLSIVHIFLRKHLVIYLETGMVLFI